ncbi:bifunctional phosphoribosylaminoimidazolecarboxamide formyltransferase/IMP cyclohydrolase, partial [Candidatus Woesearchaeota archaeon]|nr:bifunctional phosphoribosylaminoimidazolecarboxamide formyltransferase/IMP cyclohydrolase [Candidatus Woesearchaeota archaeon]
MKKNALISVSNKEGIVEFAKGLIDSGYHILSTGGTAKKLRESNVAVTEISQYTKFPEMMDGRVKTLHPKIFGGILALRNNKEHMQQAKYNDIEQIDIVVVNLYPFEETVARNASFEEAIENIDIGGPSLLRAAAKSYQDIKVVVDPADYGKVLKSIKGSDNEINKKLALKVFEHTARYDSIINNYFMEKFNGKEFPETLNLTFKKKQDLRYGENP